MNKEIAAMKAAFSMTKQRCLNPGNRDYPYYGGRGITVCKRWLDSFDNFLADMGVRPPGMTLERKENSKGYSKSNCVWATRAGQGANTRGNKNITYQGITDTVAGWERRKGFKAGTIKARLNLLGYTVEEALTKPVKYGLRSSKRSYAPRRAPDMSNIPKGLNSPLISFTAAEIKKLRASYARGGESFSSLARKHNVSVTTASNAIQGKGPYKNV